MTLKRYQKDKAKAQEIINLSDKRRTNKCLTCSNKGHFEDECPNACKNPRCVGVVCTFTNDKNGVYTRAFRYIEDGHDHSRNYNATMTNFEYQNNKHLREKCPVKPVENDSKERKTYHCTLCDIDGHDLEHCRKKCNNSKCSEKESHFYNDCELRRCKFCFGRHPVNNECDYDEGKKYIIGQYKKNNVCECIAVEFWNNFAPKCIEKYDKTTNGPFFKTYVKPYVLEHCPYGGYKCGVEFKPGKFCSGHHSQVDHGYFY